MPEPAAAPDPIPVLVLAGFLGSGKTTLLNHLLHNREGARIGALVNDFGAIEVDAMAVAGQVDAMASFGNGCLCCAVDPGEMDEMLERLARPSAGLDLIVIEASGLAEPQTLIRTVLASSDRRIVYGGLVEVVDGAEFENTRLRHPELDRHLNAADLVVLNKTDRISPEERSGLLAELGRLAGDTPVVTAAHGRIDPGLFFDRVRKPEETAGARQLTFEDLLRAEDGAGDGHAHPHTDYQSVEFTSSEPLSPRRFLEFLDSRPAGLYRIKGTVHFGAGGEGRKYPMHAVGGFLRFYPEPWPRGEQPATGLVMIGTGLDAEELRARLADCVGPGAEETGPAALYGVQRFTDRPAAPSGPAWDEPATDPRTDPDTAVDPDTAIAAEPEELSGQPRY